MSPIASLSMDALTTQVSDITQSEHNLVSLDDRLIQAFSQNAVGVGMEKNSILQRLEQPGLLSNPAVLMELQQRTSNYNLHVSMISTLTRKTVGAVESLLRS